LRRSVVMRNGQPSIKIIDSAGTPHHLQGGHTGYEVGWRTGASVLVRIPSRIF